MRRTKIVATIGPASADPAVLARMIRAGMDVARLNFSHGSRADHVRAIRAVRTASQRVGRHVGLLLDLQGPRLRVGEFEGGSIRVSTGSEVWVSDRQRDAASGIVPIIYSGLMRDVGAGDRVLIDDGKVELRVLGKGRKGLRCRVVVGGAIGDHKGVNFPGVRLSAPSLTSKDREDLALGLSRDVDFVALSFVRGPEDIIGLRRLVRSAKQSPMLIAKIERREAIENLEAILDATDGVMVARGDLGVEYPPERVPILQKRIIERANANEVVVITATQMLESMVTSSKPTRAEASDVANAIFDGTDAVMLSAETAVGRYPEKVVRTMARIASEADEFAATKRAPRRGDGASLVSPTHALAHTAYQAAREIRARALVIFTHTGYSARLVAKSRPQSPILALTPLEATCRRLTLAWGVHPVMVPRWRTAERMVETGIRLLIHRKMLQRGDWVVAMAGTTTRSGGTNMMRILQQGRPPDRPRR
ncbi:MAG TPA: pyruvate kinase [Candidatus Eisenbacteria bacterium]